MPTPAETTRPLDEQRERFLRRVAVVGDCWVWTGKRSRRGYGVVTVAQRRVKAHRRSYELFVGPIAEGKGVLHSCDNPPCVKPAHLRQGTQVDNGADVAERRRARFADVTHCKNGHEFTAANTQYAVDPRSNRERRHCRTCRRLAARQWWRNRNPNAAIRIK